MLLFLLLDVPPPCLLPAILLLPQPGIPTLFDLAKVVGLPLLILLVGRYINLRDKRREAETALAVRLGQETANERKLWREGVVANIKTNAADINKETAARVNWQLENATDLARVVDILKEFVQVQQQIAVMATTTQHHASEITRLHIRLEESAKHLNDFIMRHVKSANS